MSDINHLVSPIPHFSGAIQRLPTRGPSPVIISSGSSSSGDAMSVHSRPVLAQPLTPPSALPPVYPIYNDSRYAPLPAPPTDLPTPPSPAPVFGGANGPHAGSSGAQARVSSASPSSSPEAVHFSGGYQEAQVWPQTPLASATLSAGGSPSPSRIHPYHADGGAMTGSAAHNIVPANPTRVPDYSPNRADAGPFVQESVHYTQTQVCHAGVSSPRGLTDVMAPAASAVSPARGVMPQVGGVHAAIDVDEQGAGCHPAPSARLAPGGRAHGAGHGGAQDKDDDGQSRAGAVGAVPGQGDARDEARDGVANATGDADDVDDVDDGDEIQPSARPSRRRVTVTKSKKVTVTQKSRKKGGRAKKGRGRRQGAAAAPERSAPAAAAGESDDDNAEDGESDEEPKRRVFSAKDALIIAKVWVAQSRSGPNQREDGMYEEIADTCSRLHNINRTVCSIKSFWHRLAHDTQIYLACEATVAQRRMSGHTKESLAEIVMEMYRMKNKRREADGTWTYAPAFRYIDAAHFLEMEPKFSDKYGDYTLARSPARSTAAQSAQTGSQQGSNPDVDTNGTSTRGTPTKRRAAQMEDETKAARPIGAKRQKQQEAVTHYMKKNSDVIKVIADEIKQSNTLFRESTLSFERASAEIRDGELLKSLLPTSEEYKVILGDILRDRAAMRARLHAAEAAANPGAQGLSPETSNPDNGPITSPTDNA